MQGLEMRRSAAKLFSGGYLFLRHSSLFCAATVPDFAGLTLST
jgi:hypothetical protein